MDAFCKERCNERVEQIIKDTRRLKRLSVSQTEDKTLPFLLLYDLFIHLSLFLSFCSFILYSSCVEIQTLNLFLVESQSFSRSMRLAHISLLKQHPEPLR